MGGMCLHSLPGALPSGGQAGWWDGGRCGAWGRSGRLRMGVKIDRSLFFFWFFFFCPFDHYMISGVLVALYHRGVDRSSDERPPYMRPNRGGDADPGNALPVEPRGSRHPMPSPRR